MLSTSYLEAITLVSPEAAVLGDEAFRASVLQFYELTATKYAEAERKLWAAYDDLLPQEQEDYALAQILQRAALSHVAGFTALKRYVLERDDRQLIIAHAALAPSRDATEDFAAGKEPAIDPDPKKDPQTVLEAAQTSHAFTLAGIGLAAISQWVTERTIDNLTADDMSPIRTADGLMQTADGKAMVADINAVTDALQSGDPLDIIRWNRRLATFNIEKYGIQSAARKVTRHILLGLIKLVNEQRSN